MLLPLNLNVTTLLLCLSFLCCTSQRSKPGDMATSGFGANKNVEWMDTTFKTIHIYVALCDNKYQGIVPVPAKIGNGQDPDNNLYWGCAFGIRTYFKNSREWKLIES